MQRHRDRLSFVEVEEAPKALVEDSAIATLVAMVRSGDRAAFEPLYTRFFPRVYEQARVLLRDPHEAENVAHDVFAEAFRSLSESSSWDAPLDRWLAITTRNIAHKHRRKHGRVAMTQPHELERLCDELSDRAGAHGQGAMSRLEAWQLTSLLTAAQRAVLELRYQDDLTPEEIAETLGRSRGSVDTLHHRAMTTLRARVQARTDASGNGRGHAAFRALGWTREMRRAPGFSPLRVAF